MRFRFVSYLRLHLLPRHLLQRHWFGWYSLFNQTVYRYIKECGIVNNLCAEPGVCSLKIKILLKDKTALLLGNLALNIIAIIANYYLSVRGVFRSVA